MDYFAEHAEISEAEDYLRNIVEFCKKSINSFISSFDDRIYLSLIHISAHSDEQLEAFLKPFTPTDPKDYQYFNYYFKILECLAV